MSDDLDELKKKKLEQMKEQGGQAAAREQQEQQMKQQLKQIAKQILTEDARERLNNLRVAQPDLASQIELQLVQLKRSGQIPDKITDEQLKELLKKVQGSDEDERTLKYR